MSCINTVVLSGNLTRKPEYFPANEEKTSFARFVLASNRNDTSVDFIPCVVFGKLAEFADGYLEKGSKVMVMGRVSTGHYMNDNGSRVNTFEIAVSSIDAVLNKPAKNKTTE